MEKKQKRKLSIILTLVMTMLLSVMSVQAATAKDTKANALKAYTTFLTKKSINMKSNKQTYNVELANAKFALAYIDNNNIPELIVWGPATEADNSDVPSYIYMSATQVYTFKNGKVVRTKVGGGNRPDSKSIAKYYKKKNIAIVNNWSGGDEYVTVSGKRQLWYLYSKYYAENMDSQLTRKQWNAKLKKLVGTTKTTTIKYYKNTKANRKKHLK